MDEMPGMIRPDLQALPQVKDRIFSPHPFPRTCGGDPRGVYRLHVDATFSPHTRG